MFQKIKNLFTKKQKKEDKDQHLVREDKTKLNPKVDDGRKPKK